MPAMHPLPVTFAIALGIGLGAPSAAQAVTLRAEIPGPALFIPTLPGYEHSSEDVYRVEHRLQRFALDPAASTVRHVRKAPRVAPVDPGAPVEDSVTVHPLSGSILATFTEHHWEEHTHSLHDGEVEWTLVRPVHNESTLELDGLRLAGMPRGFALPGYSAVFSGDRYRGPRDSCSGFGPEQTAVCSWTGTGPPTRYEAWLDADTLTVEGLVRIRDFLSPQGAEYYTFEMQATAVPVPAAAWLLAGALACLPWRRRGLR